MKAEELNWTILRKYEVKIDLPILGTHITLKPGSKVVLPANKAEQYVEVGILEECGDEG